MRGDQDGASELRVLIAAQTFMSGELLARAVAGEAGYLAAAVGYPDALGALAKDPAEVMVIAADLRYETQDGYDLAREVSAAYPDVRIVMVMDRTTQAAVISAFRSGALGVISREQPLVEFYDCISHAAKRRLWIGAKETGYLLDLLRSIPAVSPASSLSDCLTMRELQVVRLAATGKTNKEIAGELGLSEHTVKNYLFRAFEKLGVSSRVELLFSLTLGGQAQSIASIEALESKN